MACWTLLQLFTLSIILTKQTETRTLAQNQKYNVNNTLVNKHLNKTDVSDRNGTVPKRDINVQRRVFTSPENPSKHDIELRNRYIVEQMLNEEAEVDNLMTEQPSDNGRTSLPNELTSNEEKYTDEDGQMNLINNDLLEELALKTAIKKVKQELTETKYEQNDESLQNAAKEHLTLTKPIQRREHLTTRHHNTENSLVADVENGIRKIEHREKINHIFAEIRENDINKLQRPNEFKIAAKYDNKLKYIDNKTHDALSLENEQYELKHFDDTAEVGVSKQINLDYTTKYKQNKKHLTGKPIKRREHMTTGHHNTNTRTTHSMTENSLIAEVHNGIRKIEHREKIDHKTTEKRENYIYTLQRPNELKIASKHDNKLKYIDNKTHDVLSLENKPYKLQHVDDTAELWVSKQINLEHTPKYKQNKKHLTDIPIQRREHLTTRHHNTTTRTTRSTTENSLIAEVDNSIRKIEHREKRNHKFPEKRENDIRELQHPKEFKIAAKHDNKLKYIDNKTHDVLSLENKPYKLQHVDDTAEVGVSKQINLEYTTKYKYNFKTRQHRDDIVTKDQHSNKRKDEGERILDSGDTSNTDEVGKTLKRVNKGSKLKHRHNKNSNTMSLENEIYTFKNHLKDFHTYTPKFSQNYQKKKYDNIANKNKHIGKPKNKPEEVVSNIYKRNHHTNKLHFINKRSTNKIREDERIFDSRPKKKDKFKNDAEYFRTVTQLDDRQGGRKSNEDTLDSSEEPFKQNKSFRLPFYISTTTLVTKDEDLKHGKEKKDTKTLLDDLNTVLNENQNRNNDIVFNQTINRLVSSKIFDFITDTVAGQMLNKLQTMRGINLLSEHQFKAKVEEGGRKEVKPDKVEQIDILLKKDGKMRVVMSQEHVTDTEKNDSGGIETIYLE